MATEPSADPLVGTVLNGAYRITRLAAVGGMATVYEAVQLRLAKRVAIKLMARHLAANQKALTRFRREVEITARLRDPHLVRVIDYGQAETGEPYLVMEYLEGEDLEHRLERVTRMPIEAVARLVGQVASALNAAHAQGIVHRDLKPANIFLVQVPGEPDFVKVLDFGISKMMAAHTRLTNAARTVGTPIYMSPEQATGRYDAIDHRIDQWALACIAWEMLLGTPPFVALDTTELLYQVIRMEPNPLTPQVPGLPMAVEPVLRRALRKQAADRFPSIRDFSNAFEAAALGRPTGATPTSMPAPTHALPDDAIVVDSDSRVAEAPDSPPADLAPQDGPKPGASSPWWKSGRVVRSGFGPDARSSKAPNTSGIQASGDACAGERASFAQPLGAQEVRNPSTVPRAADDPESARTATWRLSPRAAWLTVIDKFRIRMPPWNRIKPIHAIVVAPGVLLFLGAFLLFRAGPAPTAATRNATIPVISPLIGAPSPPRPAASVVVTPEPNELKPVGIAAEPPRARRAKAAAPAKTTGREKVKRRTTPSPPDRRRAATAPAAMVP